MYKFIIGTTPTIKFVFHAVDPSDFVTAILTIKDRFDTIQIRKTLDEAFVGENYIYWTLTQEDTIRMGAYRFTAMCNWVTEDGIRGASEEVDIKGVPNHIEGVL